MIKIVYLHIKKGRNVARPLFVRFACRKSISGSDVATKDLRNWKISFKALSKRLWKLTIITKQ